MVAEDSWGRAQAARADPGNPGGRPVVDAIWNFAFRDECRRLLGNEMHTQWGQPARRERVQAMVTGRCLWDDWSKSFKPGFETFTQAVNYLTSHDVEKPGERRLMTELLGGVLAERGLGDGSPSNVRTVVDRLSDQSEAVRSAHAHALDRVRSAFVLLLSSIGIPMFLAGEEFADTHDLDPADWRLKMSDPVNWRRRGQPGHAQLLEGVRRLIELRVGKPALRLPDIDFFYFHPGFDDSDGVRVFAYARTGGSPLGSPGQIVVVANCGPHDFPRFDLPWPWGLTALEEPTPPLDGSPISPALAARVATLSLRPFQARLFAVS